MAIAALDETLSSAHSITANYTVEIDKVDESEWNHIVSTFDDANLMQTWAYGSARWGRKNLSHMVLRTNGEVISAAQVVIRKVPVLGCGLAYVKSGPLWQRRGRCTNVAIFRHTIQALKVIYGLKRGLFVRIFPAALETNGELLRSLFAGIGFRRDLTIGTPRTAIVDLSHSLQDLRSSLRPSWRRNLVLAERNNLTITHNTTNDLFKVFTTLYAEMLRRKEIVGVVNIAYFARIQETLPSSLKMRVMICKYRGEAIAGLVVPFLGNTAQSLLAATGDKGLTLRGSYLLHWNMLEWLKSNFCRWYDLDSIGEEGRYPGVSQFKLGLAGRLGLEVEYCGRFDCCTSPTSAFLVRALAELTTKYTLLKRHRF